MNDRVQIPLRPKWIVPLSIINILVGILALVIGVWLFAIMLLEPQFTSLFHTLIAIFSLVVFRVLQMLNHLLLHDDAFWYNLHQRKNRCPYCLYDIRGLPQPRCPECGEEIGKANPA